MSTVLASTGPSVYWYLTRASGTVALILLSGAIVLGLSTCGAGALHAGHGPSWTAAPHVSLLAMVFLGIHILTSVLDSFAPISLLDAFVPFMGSYRPFCLGLGAAAFNLLLAVTIRSLSRQRMGNGTWRAVDWLTYASWGVALLHGLGTGSDIKSNGCLRLPSCAWLLCSLLCSARDRRLARVSRSQPDSPGRHRHIHLGSGAVAGERPAGL